MNLLSFLLILAVDLVIQEELLTYALIIWAMFWAMSPMLRGLFR